MDKDGAQSVALREVLKLPPNVSALMKALGERQQQLALALPAEQCCVLDAQATSPFASGLGLEHPIENGFAFLSPYGLPYLAGTGVKGVLRRAAEELRDEGEPGIDGALINTLFGPENSPDARRGALTCWDVLPQFDAMTVEIMTPHQSRYYQGTESPHDAGKPTPISFLALPAGAKFRFVFRFEPSLVPEACCSALTDWQTVVMRIASHAFDWLGFGAKTAVGYGAMAEDKAARDRREQQMAAAQDAAAAALRELRKADMSPEQIEAEDADLWIAEFQSLLAAEKATKRYKPGSAFDQQRAVVLERASALLGSAVRLSVASVLRESYKFTNWPGNKERKQAVKELLTRLDGQV